MSQLFPALDDSASQNSNNYNEGVWVCDKPSLKILQRTPKNVNLQNIWRPTDDIILTANAAKLTDDNMTKKKQTVYYNSEMQFTRASRDIDG